MNLRLIGAAAAALSLLATSWTAQAADIPRPTYKGAPTVVAYYNWTGPYAGLNVGYGWGTSNWDAPALSTRVRGMVAGGQLGYNYQVGSFVYGLEGDFDWANVRGSDPCGAFTCETRNRWLATARGRLGFAVDRFMPYLTGGAAYGRVQATTTNPALGGANSNRLGWTLGGGLEYAFLGNWTAKLEYLYVDLGRFDCGGACFAGAVTNNVSFRESIVRAGINYRFAGPVFSRF